jgi:hypothetical protein
MSRLGVRGLRAFALPPPVILPALSSLARGDTGLAVAAARCASTAEAVLAVLAVVAVDGSVDDTDVPSTASKPYSALSANM